MPTQSTTARLNYRPCPLCEATCGLEVTVDGERVTRVRGDRADLLSAGYVCPKGVALGELHHDPDRLRRPLLRAADGFREVSWAEAFAAVEAGLAPVLAAGDRNAIALYAGNPVAHNYTAGLYLRPLVKALRSQNFFTSSTVDQMPSHLVAGLLFGDPLALPVPDIERTDFLLMLGANPWESNGSLWTVPDFPARRRALARRGGRMVVVDPRRTRTAQHADRHLAIRPGTDAAWLLALLHTICAEDLARPGRLASFSTGLAELPARLAAFTPERVAAHCGIAAGTTRELARELATSPAAAIYVRFGVQASATGTLATWAALLLNLVTGNLDRPGGLMFPLAAHDRVRGQERGGFKVGRWRSRVRGCPEVMSELPVAVLPEEIETPGPGQVRALITVGGNPVLSNPDGGRLARALGGLAFMVSVDLYLNETSRHAHVILPPPSPLARDHYDLMFNRFAVRAVVRYAEPVFAPEGPAESEILARLALIAGGHGATADPGAIDTALLTEILAREGVEAHSPLAGRAPAELVPATDGASPPARLLDALLRSGPWGDAYGGNPRGLNLARLRAAPHGLDFGPLGEALPARLRTASGGIEILHPAIDAELARLGERLGCPPAGDDALRLVGRREFKSNNSWMHNLPSLIGTEDACVLLMHPADAARRGLAGGMRVRLRGAAGSIDVPMDLDDSLAPGVVSLPHGYGHGREGVRLAAAQRFPGASYNDVVAGEIDVPSGNAVLNGVAVEVSAA